MELLPHQSAYTGPPPRYAVNDTVYHQGRSYTVTAVVGRAPTVGWVYEVDGPGEVLRVGEGEISEYPREDLTTAGDYLSRMLSNLGIPAVAARSIQGAWLSISTDPTVLAVAQQLADEEATIHQIAALSGMPPTVCRAALAASTWSITDLLKQLKNGTAAIIRTTDGGEIIRLFNPALYTDDYTALTTPSPPPLNRAARRAKHRPWSPPPK